MKKNKSILTIFASFILAVTLMVMPNVSYGAIFTEAQFQSASNDSFGGSDTTVVEAEGGSYVPNTNANRTWTNRHLKLRLQWECQVPLLMIKQVCKLS